MSAALLPAVSSVRAGRQIGTMVGARMRTRIIWGSIALTALFVQPAVAGYEVCVRTTKATPVEKHLDWLAPGNRKPTEGFKPWRVAPSGELFVAPRGCARGYCDITQSWQGPANSLMDTGKGSIKESDVAVVACPPKCPSNNIFATGKAPAGYQGPCIKSYSSASFPSAS